MINNFIKASFYIFSMSFSCILNDILSKKINIDTYSLLFLRFLYSAVLLTMFNVYINYEKISKRSLFFLSLISISFSIQLILLTLASNTNQKVLTFITFITLSLSIFFPISMFQLKIFSINILMFFLYSLFDIAFISTCSVCFFNLINSINIVMSFYFLSLSSNLKKNFRTFFSFNNLIRGGLISLGMMFFLNGLRNLSLGIVILLNFCTPIFTVLLSKIFLKEVLGHRLITCFINTIGIFIAIFPSISTINLFAVFSIIAASICFASIDIFNKFNLKNNESLLDLLIGSSFISTMFFSIPIFLNKPLLDSFSSYDFFISILIGILAILIPFFAIKASQFSDLSALQPLKYIEFPLSIAASYLFFNDSYTYHVFIGFFIIIIGCFFSYFQEIRNSSRH